MKQRKNLTFLDKTYIWILLVIFGGIVIHAPISVGFGTLFPGYSLLIKSWKEVLMLVAGVMGIYLLWKNKRFEILRDPLLILIAIYTLLHLVLIALIPESLTATLAGLAIDLRYLLFFSLVYIHNIKMFLSKSGCSAQ